MGYAAGAVGPGFSKSSGERREEQGGERKEINVLASAREGMCYLKI